MKPQNTVLIMLACVAGVALSLVLGFALIDMMPRHEPPRFVFNANDAPFAAADVGDDFAMQPGAGVQQPCPPEALATLRGPVAATKDCTVSGPFTHANLSLYLIHGPDSFKEMNILTLQEALNQNLAFVHEGRIAVDNRSKSPLFIQGGDIIKGGCQDRVLPYDQLIPPESQGVPVDAFCVEAGRSSPRGQELSTGFQSANEQLPGKRL